MVMSRNDFVGEVRERPAPQRQRWGSLLDVLQIASQIVKYWEQIEGGDYA